MSELSKYQKLSLSLKGYLKGKGYHRALEAFEFAKEHHTGFRKDGRTPNFQHQIEICLLLITLKEVQNEEEVIIAGLLHDVREDHNVEDFVIRQKFGNLAAEVCERLTKEFKGVKKDMNHYFSEISQCPIASLVKLADRINNFSSMVGVFTIPKQEEYVFELKEYFYPLLKAARNRFPHQQLSYHAMGTFLKSMCKTVEAVLVAEKELIQIKQDSTQPRVTI